MAQIELSDEVVEKTIDTLARDVLDREADLDSAEDSNQYLASVITKRDTTIDELREAVRIRDIAGIEVSESLVNAEKAFEAQSAAYADLMRKYQDTNHKLEGAKALMRVATKIITTQLEAITIYRDRANEAEQVLNSLAAAGTI